VIQEGSVYSYPVQIHPCFNVHSVLRTQENVLVDEYGCPRIANFGLTWVRRTYSQGMDSAIFRSRRGTVHFQAPELLSQQDVEAHEAEPTTMSDMYALAMTSVQIFIGCLPFGDELSDERVQFLAVNASIRPERPSSTSGELDCCLWYVIQRAWARSPSDRIDVRTFLDAFTPESESVASDEDSEAVANDKESESVACDEGPLQ